MRAKILFALPFAILLGASGFTCGPTTGVVHPKAGEVSTAEACGDLSDNERSCSSCVSKPGCGWIEGGSPSAQCVPGTREGPEDSTQLAGGAWAGELEACAQPTPVSEFEYGVKPPPGS